MNLSLRLCGSGSCSSLVYRAGEMRQLQSQKMLAEAVAAQQLPKLSTLRAAARDAFVSPSPELFEMTSPMGSRSPQVLQSSQKAAHAMLIASMKV